MNAKKIKPLSGSEKIFRISLKRIQIAISERNEFGKMTQLVCDYERTKLRYQKLLDSIPTQSGILIITGINKSSSVTLEVLRSYENLRSAFSRPKDKNRLQILMQYLNNHSFNYLLIQLAQES